MCRVRTTWFRNESAEVVILYGLNPGTEMKLKKKHPSEADVFREAMAGVRQLTPANCREHHRVKAEPIPRQRHLDEQLVLQELMTTSAVPSDLECGEELLYLRPGHSPHLVRKLRRGHFSVADTIDLHHLSEPVARDVLAGFLANSARRGLGCVRVVHGKGLGSPGRQPVLKGKVRSWLVQRQEVLAFAQATGPDGGAGALIVLLDSA